ncbi:MAG TPA: hypothetical protein VFH51_02320, partial [Myxococcota bacterium]|nr:hypothetical protein [Myxococcota bacterium]
FINGKLLGALSYAFATFAKEPICGITPIESMLDVMRLPDESRPWRIGPSISDADWDALRSGSPVATAATHRGDGPVPIATPLMLGGFPPAVVTHFEPWLRSMGFEPLAGGTGSASSKISPTPLKPGSAVAAVLIRGDMDVAATGTVTTVEGNTVLAFGHPFFGAGAVSIPMANAEILNTMASSMRSFKMSSTGATLGEITQDRLTAIGGFIGGHPTMIPVQGSIKTSKATSKFNLEIARDLAMSPRLVAMGIAGALSGRVDAGERGTVRFKGEIKVEGQPPVPVRNVYAAERDGGLMTYAAIDMARTFAALWDTPFGTPPKVEMTVDATLDPDPVSEWVEALNTDRSQVRVGENLEVAIRLRRLSGPSSLERFSIPIPYAWRGQSIDLVAGGVDVAEHVAHEVSGGPRPTEYKQLGRWLARRRQDGVVYLMAVRDGVGMQAAVDEFKFLPPSVVATLSGDPSKQSRSQGLAWEERRNRPGVVSGQARTTVQVLSY